MDVDDILEVEEIHCCCYFVHKDDGMFEFSCFCDALSCDKCTELNGKIFTPEEAKGIIPVH